MDFKGMTQEYRKSDEYISWMRAVKIDYPDMPVELIEKAIIYFKMEPRAYRNEHKESKKPKELPRPVKMLYDDSFTVYTGEDDPNLPVLIPAPGSANPNTIFESQDMETAE